jgi:hypothetical protein
MLEGDSAALLQSPDIRHRQMMINLELLTDRNIPKWPKIVISSKMLCDLFEDAINVYRPSYFLELNRASEEKRRKAEEAATAAALRREEKEGRG